MLGGAILSAIGVALLTLATTLGGVVAFGSLMALGSAAFTAANWARLADTSPSEEGGRYLGLANIGTAGAAAVAGLLGVLIERGGGGPGGGYGSLFLACGLLFAASAALVVVDRAGSDAVSRTGGGRAAVSRMGVGREETGHG
jgi:MFS family permease